MMAVNSLIRGDHLVVTAKVEIYTTPLCPYCDRAKHLLHQKGVEFTEIDVGEDSEVREKMVQRTGGRTSVPQIFIDDVHVGGSDDLYTLERSGKLDEMLGIS